MRLLLLSLLLSSALTNADIVRLVKAGLSVETIEAKIATSKTGFDTSTDALVGLAGEGVPDPVIRAMVLASAPPAVASGSVAPAPPRAAAPATRAVSRRYDVDLVTEQNTRCTGAELRLDGKGISASRCRKLDFNVPWAGVSRVCFTYGFRGLVTLETSLGRQQISTTTPAEAKRIVDHVRTNAPAVPISECGT